MTKKEKLEINKHLGLLWMQIRAYKNGTKNRTSTGSDWKAIQSKYQEYMATQDELIEAIKIPHPKLIEQIIELKYPNDIEKAITCLNLIVPSDQ